MKSGDPSRDPGCRASVWFLQSTHCHSHQLAAGNACSAWRKENKQDLRFHWPPHTCQFPSLTAKNSGLNNRTSGLLIHAYDPRPLDQNTSPRYDVQVPGKLAAWINISAHHSTALLIIRSSLQKCTLSAIFYHDWLTSGVDSTQHQWQFTITIDGPCFGADVHRWSGKSCGSCGIFAKLRRVNQYWFRILLCHTHQLKYKLREVTTWREETARLSFIEPSVPARKTSIWVSCLTYQFGCCKQSQHTNRGVLQTAWTCRPLFIDVSLSKAQQEWQTEFSSGVCACHT